MDRVVTFQEFSELKDWMISHFTTKQDIALLRKEITQNFATKEDLELFATKEDLKLFATKEEVLPRLERLEQDVSVLKQDVAVLKYDMIIVKQDMAELKQEVAEFKSETLTRFDKVFGFLEKLDQERIFTHEAILRIEEKLSK